MKGPKELSVLHDQDLTETQDGHHISPRNTGYGSSWLSTMAGIFHVLTHTKIKSESRRGCKKTSGNTKWRHLSKGCRSPSSELQNVCGVPSCFGGEISPNQFRTKGKGWQRMEGNISLVLNVSLTWSFCCVMPQCICYAHSWSSILIKETFLAAVEQLKEWRRSRRQNGFGCRLVSFKALTYNVFCRAALA